MQQDITGQVLGVTGKPTSNGGTKFDVAFSDGNSYSTFDGAMAQKANSLVNQAVSARVESKPSRDGQRVFWNLVDVAPQGQLAPGAAPLGGQTVNLAQAAQSLVPTGNIPIVQGNPAKDAQIAKSVAVKVAAEIVAGLFSGAGPEALSESLDAFDTVGKHVLGILTGSPSQGENNSSPQVVPAEQTPEAVATAVNEAAGQEVVAAGAVPEW